MITYCGGAVAAAKQTVQRRRHWSNKSMRRHRQSSQFNNQTAAVAKQAIQADGIGIGIGKTIKLSAVGGKEAINPSRCKVAANQSIQADDVGKAVCNKAVK